VAAPPSLADVNHRSFDQLLQKYVNDRGLVGYASWKSDQTDMKALDDYLAVLGCVDLRKSVPANARLAYWINAYNAATLKGVLREYPTTSIRNHAAKDGYNIWKDLLLWIDGGNYSLDDIEHTILRKVREPRIHFGINCASLGCPPLVNQAFTADNVDKLLDSNARRFFADPRNFRVDAGTRTVHISTLLEWYGTDFAATPQAQVRMLRRYFPNAETLTWLDSGDFSVKHLPYDWNINEAK
jgi:hypothetical protein